MKTYKNTYVMKTMKLKTIAALLVMVTALPAYAQAQGDGKLTEKMMNTRWTRVAEAFGDGFFTTPEAARIGDNLLEYQSKEGGWPKNIKMQRELTPATLGDIKRWKTGERYATIDNKATTTEIIYLARLYNATKDDKYRTAVERAFGYLFEAQYANGGWPQFYPLSEGYYTHITYNDNAMVNVLKLMRKAAEGEAPLEFLPGGIRNKAEAALEKGIGCILKTQVKQDGKPTVWCAQHDEHTLEPANARAYELASLSGAESDEIVLFLMSLPHPSRAVKDCITNAVEWFKQSKITGIRLERFTNADGKRDYRAVPCRQDEKCEPLWARFYTIDGNRPFFCDRDGVKRYDVSEIGYERRNGYSWYNSRGSDVLREYEKWAEKHL